MEEELCPLLEKMKGRKILVVGDVVADVYLIGNISRISREAPVLVLTEERERVVAGGAANVVNNAATLGGEVYALGLVGEDKHAESLREILQKNGAHTEGLIASAARPTISKTRIIAGGRATVSQQIVRVDRESKERAAAEEEESLLQYLEKTLSQMEGLVLSDYGSGTITPRVRERSIELAHEYGIPCIVDSRYDVGAFTGIDYVKQNDSELAAALGRLIAGEEETIRGGRELLMRLGAKGVLVTRGELGMILVERETAHVVPVSQKSEVYDVSGAGDTCVAAFILALAAHAAPEAAARLSNYAAGVAVRKLGTATVTQKELGEALK